MCRSEESRRQYSQEYVQHDALFKFDQVAHSQRLLWIPTESCSLCKTKNKEVKSELSNVFGRKPHSFVMPRIKDLQANNPKSSFVVTRQRSLLLSINKHY